MNPQCTNKQNLTALKLSSEIERFNAFFMPTAATFPRFSEKNHSSMHFFSSFRLCLMKNA